MAHRRSRPTRPSGSCASDDDGTWQRSTADATSQPGGIDPATGIAAMDLRAALGRLDPDDRALLAMRYVAGFDSNELALALGISPSGTRNRLERLRKRLREELS